jgi:hypothetical protein
MLLQQEHYVQGWHVLCKTLVKACALLFILPDTYFANHACSLAPNNLFGTYLCSDLQWSAVEKTPKSYTLSGYKQLFEMVRASGLKLQVSRFLAAVLKWQEPMKSPCSLMADLVQHVQCSGNSWTGSSGGVLLMATARRPGNEDAATNDHCNSFKSPAAKRSAPPAL